MHHPRASAWRRDDAIRVRSSMATMATMATPRARLSKKFSQLGGVGGVNQRTPPALDFFLTTFVLGVAMVAMVATANHRADSHANTVGGSTTELYGSTGARRGAPQTR